MRRLSSLVVALAMTACSGAFYFDDGDGGIALPLDGGCMTQGCPASLVCSAPLGCVECRSAADCSGALPRCLSSLGRCAECALDGDCGVGRVCDPATHHCQQACSEDNQCSSNLCTAANGIEVCVACVNSDQCESRPTTPRCDRQRGTCVRCVADTDCGATGMRCDRLTGSCRQCRGTADCGGAACSRDGLCVP